MYIALAIPLNDKRWHTNYSQLKKMQRKTKEIVRGIIEE